MSTSALTSIQTRSPTHYVRGAMLHPTSVTVLSTAVCFAACYAGMCAALVTVVGALVVAIGATRSTFVRSHLDLWAARQRHRQRDHVRTRRVEAAGPARAHQYRELADLVDEIDEADPRAGTRFELDGLLDQFVETARCHHRCVESLRFAPTGDSPFIERSRMRSDILARRVRRREETARRITKLSDELAAIDELLHLIAHSVAVSPGSADTAAEIDRRLWELDEVETAMAELHAEAENEAA
jgi:hypothetical protein